MVIKNEDLLSITESTERDDNILMRSGIFLCVFFGLFVRVLFVLLALHKQSSDSIKTIDTLFILIKQNKEEKNGLK